MEKEAFIMQLRHMIEIKEKISELLTTFDYAPGNTLIESLIHGVGCDAKKHLELFHGLLDRAMGVTEAITKENKEIIKNLIDQVVELEWNVESQLKVLLDKLTDEKTKKILFHVLGDVQRHKVVLENIKELVESMSVEEESVLDQIWKYSVTFDE